MFNAMGRKESVHTININCHVWTVEREENKAFKNARQIQVKTTKDL